jgi:hypothetical protein
MMCHLPLVTHANLQGHSASFLVKQKVAPCAKSNSYNKYASKSKEIGIWFVWNQMGDALTTSNLTFWKPIVLHQFWQDGAIYDDH